MVTGQTTLVAQMYGTITETCTHDFQREARLAAVELHFRDTALNSVPQNLGQSDLVVGKRETAELRREEIVPVAGGIALHGLAGQERWRAHLVVDEVFGAIEQLGKVTDEVRRLASARQIPNVISTDLLFRRLELPAQHLAWMLEPSNVGRFMIVAHPPERPNPLPYV